MFVARRAGDLVYRCIEIPLKWVDGFQGFRAVGTYENRDLEPWLAALPTTTVPDSTLRRENQTYLDTYNFLPRQSRCAKQARAHPTHPTHAQC